MRRALYTGLGLTLALSGCSPFSGFVHDETLVGPWRLVAVDVDSDMILCRSLDGSDCVGDGLPGPRIIAAGADDRHIVLVRRAPLRDAATGAVVDEYYYLVRTPDEAVRGPYGQLRGPFDAGRFATEKQRLGLPEFSRVFLPLS